MKRSRALLLSALCALAPVAVSSHVSATSAVQAAAGSASKSESGVAGSIADKPIAGYRTELLDLAFKAATAMPVEPHIKNRSRAQDAVVAVCFELDQPRRALRCVEKIDNWLRGAGYADFAFYCAQHGDTSEVQHYLDLAQKIADLREDENPQDWQRDRIRAKIARTHLWLGQSQEAARFEAGIADSEAGKVEAVKAMLVSSDALDERIKALDASVTTGNFDQVRNALEACAQIFNRCYDDQDRRSRLEERIKTSSKKLPLLVRIDLEIELAQFALDHGDQAKALELADEAQLIVDTAKWTTEDRVPLMARLAALRYRAGAKEKARIQVDAARTTFDAERNKVVNIYRASVLRALAEAYQSMGETATALSVYRRAVEEGVENPNSKPRAEDLSATCRSMALHEVEPDSDLWKRMRQICDGLSAPW